MEQHRVEVHVREVDALLRAVVDALARQVAVEVHLPQADGVGGRVALGDGRHRLDVGHDRHGRQRTDRGLHGPAEVRRVHGLGDVHRAEVAGDVLAHVGVAQVLVVLGGLGDLQDLGAQVGHGDAALDRVRGVHGVLEHDVRVAGLELDLGDGLEELARVDLGLLDPRVVDHLVVLLGHGDLGERHPVDALDVVRREQVHVLVLLRQLERDVRDHDAEGEGLDADLLVRVLALGVEEAVDVRVVRVEVHRAGALARAELVGVGEGVLEELHHGDDAGGLVLDLLDGRAVLADVGQREGHAAAALGQLQGGVDAAGDRLHVVLDAQQEAGDELAALLLARVEERGGGRLEAAGDHLVHQVGGQLLVAPGQVEGDDGDAVLVALEVALAVEGLQGVRGVELERAEEGREAELGLVGTIEQAPDELERVLLERLGLVVVVLLQVVELLLQVVEEHRVGVDMLQEVLARGRVVGLELDATVGAVEVQHGVELVVAEVLPLGGHVLRLADEVRLGGCGGGHVHSPSRPPRTRSTSSGVPISSNLYMRGTWHLREMM